MEFEQIIQEYKKNGFVVAKDIIDKDLIDSCKFTLCKMSGQKPSDDIENSLNKLFFSSQERYLQTLRTFSKSLSLQNLFMSYRLKQLIRMLGIEIATMPTQPITHATSKSLVINDGSLGVSAHQDWPSIQGSLDSLVVWVPFVNVNDDNYPLQILPKSHLDGLRHAEIQNNISQIDLSNKEIESLVDVSCEPGDAVIFSTFTVHRTKQLGSGFRFAASIRFDNALEDSFISRNFPCAYKRSVDRNLSYSPEKNEINRFFI